jgi:steroid 5-alpha reductase family enzyme
MLGVAVALLGLAFEAIADAQLSVFRVDPESRGTVLDQGLWRYSRHPNYFGEACFWWGLGLLALSGGGWAGLLSLLSPLLMTFLLLKVSGVGLLEADLLQRKGEAYQEYVASTPAFVPGRPRKDVA